MPDAHRCHFKEISEKHFQTLITALKETRVKFEAEAFIGEKNRLAARYVRTYGMLARAVSLKLLGVPDKLIHGQIESFLGMGKGASPEQAAQSGRHGKGSNEETLTQLAQATG
jgi:hypothetical protein